MALTPWAHQEVIYLLFTMCQPPWIQNQMRRGIWVLSLSNSSPLPFPVPWRSSTSRHHLFIFIFYCYSITVVCIFSPSFHLILEKLSCICWLDSMVPCFKIMNYSSNDQGQYHLYNKMQYIFETFINEFLKTNGWETGLHGSLRIQLVWQARYWLPLFWTIFKGCLYRERTWKKGSGLLLENRESLPKALEGKDGVFLQNKGNHA